MSLNRPTIIQARLNVDDRGSVYGFDNLDKFNIKRTYFINNWQVGTVRAWHGHMRADTLIHVIKGAAKICAMNMEEDNDYLIKTLCAENPEIFFIPRGWYNGTMTLKDDTRLLVYSTLTLEEVKSDDSRKALTQEELSNIWKVKNR